MRGESEAACYTIRKLYGGIVLLSTYHKMGQRVSSWKKD